MRILLIFWQGIFASVGNSAAAGALLANDTSIIDSSTLVPIGVFAASMAVILGLVGKYCYKRGTDDQKMKQVMLRLKELEDKDGG